MFEAKDCVKLKEGETFEKRFVFLKPSYIEHLKPEYRTAEYQLFYAVCGFGCDPKSSGNAVFGADITEHYRQERYNILGVASEKAIQEWEKTYGHSREEIIKRSERYD